MSAPDPRILHLVPDLLGIFEGDRRFFRRHPKRTHRIRLAGRAEIEEARILVGLDGTIPPGFRAFCGIRRMEAGGLYRVIGFDPETAETDLDEEAARAAYLHLAPHNNATLRKLAANNQRVTPTASQIGGPSV